MQPQCDGEDCCGNGIGDYSCYPIGWINQCSIGYYVSDKCTTNFLFRIKKDGVVIEGPLVAKSFAFTPPSGEVADYTIEYCVGVAEPCTWITLVATTEVDTTAEDACPMGIYGQTYVIGTRPSDNEQFPMGVYIYCQSFLVVRASALCFSLGQNITHLWIDDVLWTPNTPSAGAIATDSFNHPLPYSFVCHSGRDYAHTGTTWDNTTLLQLRIPLPIPFTKASCSVRARQTNGMMIGCTVPITCTAHYNAASTTLPTWGGESIACGANGGMPFGYMSDPAPVRTWCKHFETSLEIAPAMSGTFSWRTCESAYPQSMVVASFTLTYNFKCNGDIRWIDPADSVPRPVYSGTFSFDHTITLDFDLVLDATYSPGSLGINELRAVIPGDATSTITGSNSWPTALQAAAGAIDWLTVLNDTFSTNHFLNSDWFIAELIDGLECTTPTDGETFRWKWKGPQLPVEFWTVFSADWAGGAFSIVPSPISNSGGSSAVYTSAVFLVDTSLYCELPEGSYYDETDSAVDAQFQV